mmetsp:Transcript_22566/g.67198  ORF Transcript_22566/g.67198 Transcript_22566/m.67198 type:complete len:475 (+) Transcript_22566:357-1781(+)
MRPPACATLHPLCSTTQPLRLLIKIEALHTPHTIDAVNRPLWPVASLHPVVFECTAVQCSTVEQQNPLVRGRAAWYTSTACNENTARIASAGVAPSVREAQALWTLAQQRATSACIRGLVACVCLATVAPTRSGSDHRSFQSMRQQEQEHRTSRRQGRDRTLDAAALQPADFDLQSKNSGLQSRRSAGVDVTARRPQATRTQRARAPASPRPHQAGTQPRRASPSPRPQWERNPCWTPVSPRPHSRERSPAGAVAASMGVPSSAPMLASAVGAHDRHTGACNGTPPPPPVPLLLRPAPPPPYSTLIVSFLVGGRSTAGLQVKNPSGLSSKPTTSTGITGKSSTRGTCVMPNEYHSTGSVPGPSGASRSVQRDRPMHSVDCTTWSPAGKRWSSAYGVTQRLWVANLARLYTRLVGPIIILGVGPGTSLKATGLPLTALTLAGFLTSQTRAAPKSTSRAASRVERSSVSRTSNALP